MGQPLTFTQADLHGRRLGMQTPIFRPSLSPDFLFTKLVAALKHRNVTILKFDASAIAERPLATSIFRDRDLGGQGDMDTDCVLPRTISVLVISSIRHLYQGE